MLIKLQTSREDVHQTLSAVVSRSRVRCVCVCSGTKHLILSACSITVTSLIFFQNSVGSSNTKTKEAWCYYSFVEENDIFMAGDADPQTSE